MIRTHRRILALAAGVLAIASCVMLGIFAKSEGEVTCTMNIGTQTYDCSKFSGFNPSLQRLQEQEDDISSAVAYYSAISISADETQSPVNISFRIRSPWNTVTVVLGFIGIAAVVSFFVLLSIKEMRSFTHIVGAGATIAALVGMILMIVDLASGRKGIDLINPYGEAEENGWSVNQTAFIINAVIYGLLLVVSGFGTVVAMNGNEAGLGLSAFKM